MARLPTLVVLAATALIAAGCSLAPETELPVPPEAAAWNQPSAAGSGWPDAGWWNAFGSAGLDQLMTEALAGNPDLAAAAARVRQADGLAAASGAALLPAFSVQAGDSRTSSALYYGTQRPVSTYSAGVSASYELDFWGRNRSARDRDSYSALGARFDLETARLTLEADLAALWFDRAGQAERLRIVRAQIASGERLLQALRDKEEAGLATRLDIAQQESELAAQRIQLPALEQQIALDADQIAILAGRTPEQAPPMGEMLDRLLFPAVPGGLPSGLLRRRPDVAAAEVRLRAADADIGAARALFLPDISLTGQDGFASTALASLFDPLGKMRTMTASLTQPLFEGGALDAQLEQSQGRRDEAAALYRKAALAALADTEDALVTLAQTGRAGQAALAARDSARGAYALAQEQLDGGIIDIATLLNAERASFTAEDTYATTQLAHLKAAVGLFRALGGGWAQPANITDIATTHI